MKTDILTYSFLDLRDKLHRIAMRLLKNDEDAEDALQDTWLKLKVKGDVASPDEARNKLVAVLRNVCVDRLRENHPLPIDESDALRSLQCETDTEDISRLEQLLQSGLTPLQKRIFCLVTHDGLEYEEIAEVLGMSVEAVRMNMSRTRKKIRETYNALNR